MKTFKNKKGTENWVPDTMPFFIFFVVALGFSVFLFLEVANALIFEDIDIPKNVEEYIIIERFHNSPDCFAYQDETGRVYQKIIDLDKFRNNEQIGKCISTINSKFAFKLELKSPETEKFSTSTFNWAEGANFISQQKNVFIHSDNKIINGKLYIYIQNG